MSKKLISILLTVAIILGILPPIQAQAYMKEEKPDVILGEFEYRFQGEKDEPPHKMEAMLEKNTDIYVSVEDAAMLAGFSVKHQGQKYTFYRENEKIWDTLNLSMTDDGICRMNQLVVPYYDDPNEKRWYGLVHLLYYLRAQFYIDDETYGDDVAVICPAEAKDLLTVWDEFSSQLSDLRLGQRALYISKGAFGTTMDASFGVILDEGFDWRVCLSFFGSNMIIQEQYEKSLLTLAEDDSKYIVEADANEFQKVVERYHYALNDPWGAEVISVCGVTNDMIELLNEIDKSKDLPVKVLATQLDLSEDILTEIKGIGNTAEIVSTGVEVVSALYNYADVKKRSKGWNDTFVRELELLRDVDKKQFTSRNSVEQMKDAADKLVKEYKDPIMAAREAVFWQGITFGVKLLVTKTSPVGAMLGILDACISLSDVVFNDEIDKGKMTYMVDCLMDIGTVADQCLKREISAAKTEAAKQGYISQKTLDRIRAWAILSLRVTQRAYAYVYSLELEEDKNYKNTDKAKAEREVMMGALAMMGIITKTEDYDKNLKSLSGAEASSMLSQEWLQVREDLSESLWRTCYIGGEVLDDETDEPIMDARIDIYRSDNPDTVYAGASTDNAGHWDIKLDNRYDYTFVFYAEDEEHEEYQITYEGTSVEDIDEKENYIYFHTRMSKNLEELFYAYLRANVVPKIGTCDGASFVTPLGEKDMKSNGGSGLLSALVDDLDNDGSLEMVTVTVSEKESTGDMLVSLVFGTGYQTVSVDIDLYELVDGEDGKEVVHADGPKNIGYMEHISYGSSSVYACQWEGITYFVGHSTMDDMTTYGPHAMAIYHPEEGKLIFDYVAGGSWGQGLPGTDDNEKLGARKMDLTNTIFDVSGYMEKLCDLNFELKDSSYQNASVAVTIADYTYLVEALEKGYKEIRDRARELLKLIDEDEKGAREEVEANIKKLEEVMNSPAHKTAESAIDYIARTSGISLTMTSEEAADDGSYSADYQTGDKARVHIKVDESGSIVYLTTEARTYTQTAEWISLKDAILNVSQLGLPPEAISYFSGELSMQSYDEIYGGYRIQVHNIDNFFIGVTKQ